MRKNRKRDKKREINYRDKKSLNFECLKHFHDFGCYRNEPHKFYSTLFKNFYIEIDYNYKIDKYFKWYVKSINYS